MFRNKTTRAKFLRATAQLLTLFLALGSLPANLAGAHTEGEMRSGAPTTLDDTAELLARPLDYNLCFTGDCSETYGIMSTQDRTSFAPKQLIFIADGMRPDLAEKWAGSGDMPNYRRIFTDGVTGENGMVSQIAGNTGAGWSSISTGSWVGTHGQVNNTYHIVTNGILTTTSGFDASRLQAETYQEVVEKAGKKVAILDWPGALPTRIKGPVIDFRNFYSSRGVVSNFPITGYRPDPRLVHTNTLQISDAAGWSSTPQSFSPAKETSFAFSTSPITNRVVTLTWPIYLYDSTNDNTVNYDRALIAKETKSGEARVADLKMGDWAAVKLTMLRS